MRGVRLASGPRQLRLLELDPAQLPLFADLWRLVDPATARAAVASAVSSSQSQLVLESGPDASVAADEAAPA